MKYSSLGSEATAMPAVPKSVKSFQAKVDFDFTHSNLSLSLLKNMMLNEVLMIYKRRLHSVRSIKETKMQTGRGKRKEGETGSKEWKRIQ